MSRHCFAAWGIVFALCAAAQRIEVVSTKQLTEGAKVSSVAFSPDGQRMAYVDNAALWTREIATGQTKRLVASRAVYVSAFSRDGGSIVFQRTDATFLNADTYLISVDGGEPLKVISNTVRPAAFSPDSKRMAFVRSEKMPGLTRRSLFVAGQDGGGERRLITLNVAYRRSLQWSPEGDRILILDSNRTTQHLTAVNASTGQAEILVTWAGMIENYTWLPGAAGIVAVCRPTGSDTDQLWRIPLPNGQWTKLFESQEQRRIFTAVPLSDGYLVAAAKYSTTETFWDGMLGAVFGWRQPSAFDGRSDLVLIHLREDPKAKP